MERLIWYWALYIMGILMNAFISWDWFKIPGGWKGFIEGAVFSIIWGVILIYTYKHFK